MTVVNAMIFKGGGAIIADERSSTQIRQYDVAEKLSLFDLDKDKLIVGQTGMSDMLYETVRRAEKRVAELLIASGNQPTPPTTPVPSLGSKQAMHLLSMEFGSVKLEYLEGKLQGLFGWSLKDVDRECKLIGQEQIRIPSHITRTYIETINELSNNSFLGIGYDGDSEETTIYLMNGQSTKPSVIARPYCSVGSGQDQADSILTKYMQKMPREKRRDIDFLEGIVELIHATSEASTMNRGVGGIPMMYVVREGVVYNPSEDQTNVSVHVVKALKGGYLTKNKSEVLIEQLVFGDKDAKTVKDQFWRAIKRKGALRDYLLDYKS